MEGVAISIRAKLVSAVASMALLGGLAAAVSPTASAATPSCGHSCLDLFPQLYGSGFVLDVQGQGENVGQPIILAPASATNPGEDFTVSDQGTVHDFFLAGLISAGLNQLYPSNEAYEIEYAPYGAETGLCMGVAVTPTNGTPVDLEPCGVTSRTVWITVPNTGFSGSFMLINGGGPQGTGTPYALTDLKPGGQLFTWPLPGTHGNGVLNNKFSNQLWGALLGVIPSS